MGLVVPIEGFIFLFTLSFSEIQADDYCGRRGDKEFYCEKGYCCGNFECCTYYRYYEMWWFWLIWCMVTILGCCCAYYRRRHMSMYGYMFSGQAHLPQVPMAAIPGEPKYKLPSYAEVIAMPDLGPPDDPEGAPPPYFFGNLPSTSTAIGYESAGSSTSQINAAEIDTLEEESQQQAEIPIRDLNSNTTNT